MWQTATAFKLSWLIALLSFWVARAFSSTIINCIMHGDRQSCNCNPARPLVAGSGMTSRLEGSCKISGNLRAVTATQRVSQPPDVVYITHIIISQAYPIHVVGLNGCQGRDCCCCCCLLAYFSWVLSTTASTESGEVQLMLGPHHLKFWWGPSLLGLEGSTPMMMDSTPNVQIMFIQGRPSPLNLWNIRPILSLWEKHVTKSLGKTFPLHPPKFLMTFILVIDRIPGCKFPISWAPPFITSTWRGSGSGGRMWTGEGVKPMWTSTQKIKIRVNWRHPVFLSCKEVGIFLPEFLLWTE